MTLNYEEEGGGKVFRSTVRALQKNVIEAALDYAECPYEAEVNLSIDDR